MESILNCETLHKLFLHYLGFWVGVRREDAPLRNFKAVIWARQIQIASEMFSFVLIFTAYCTAIHMFLCMSNIITSFQKDRQHNEWIVKHAHKNSRVCLEVGAICSWFTAFPGLHFYISCTFSIKKKHLMGMQLILTFFFFFLSRW